MKNINEYNKEQFYYSFAESPIAKKIQEDFDLVSWEKQVILKDPITPRQFYGGGGQRLFSMTPFYYLSFLIGKNPIKIYDLGCGWNIFKKYIPNIVGIGAEDPNTEFFYGDIHDFVDNDFINHHHEFFESVFSINALHFHPIDNLREIVLNFASMIKKQGRGFLTLNVMRMIEKAVDSKFLNKDFDFDLYIREELSNLPFTYLVFDVDLKKLDEPMDGNIRLVLEKS